MKTSRILYLATALAAGLLVSCKEEVFEPGPEVSGAQVYFPNDIATEYSIGDDVASVTIPVMRVSTEGATSVDILADLKDIEDADQSLFTIPAKADFQDGKDKAEFVISFDRAKLVDGKEYKIGLLIMDEENTTPYGNRTLYISISPWPWELLGTGKYRDDWLTAAWTVDPGTEVDVQVYEHKSQKGLYMFEEMLGWTFLCEAFGGTQEEIEAALGVSYVPSNIQVNCADPAKVYIPGQSSGVSDSENGEYLIGTAQNVYGTLVDGVITFPDNCLIFQVGQNGMYANKNKMFRILLPGAEAVDYALAVQYGGMKVGADNETVSAVLDFTYGADVNGISYVFVEGDASADFSEIASKIADGTAENIYSVENFVAGAETVSVEAELTAGEYTVVALPKKKDGSLSVEDAAAAVFYFPGMGGSIPECDASVALYRFSEYPDASDIADEHPDYSDLIFEVKGSELKSVKYLMAESALIDANKDNIENIIIAQGYDLESKMVDEINQSGKTWGWFEKLDGGVSYTIVIYAVNKYGKKSLVISEPKSTATLPYSGELKIGQYNMKCTVQSQEGPFTSDNTFTLSPTLEENVFTLSPLGLNDVTAAKFYARYDAAESTLTLDGTIVGKEDKGNLFGTPLYYWNEEQTQAMGWISYVDPEGQAMDDPAVFTVDPATKQLNGLSTYLDVFVCDAESLKVLGSLAYYTPDGTSVSYVSGPSAASSRLSSSQVYMPGVHRMSLKSRLCPESLTGAKKATSRNILSENSGFQTVPVRTSVCEPLPKETARVGVNTEFPFNALAR